MAAVKDYSTRSEDEVRNAVSTAESESEIRRRIVEELAYPHDKIEVQFRQRGMTIVLLRAPNGQLILI
jgi:hypothetical protein